MEKKTTAKLDGTKAAVKAAEAKTEEKKTVVTESAEVKKETKTAAAEKVKAAAKDAAVDTKKALAETKEAAEKVKEAVKGTVTEKKTGRAARKPAVKEELKPEVFIQFQGREAVVAEVIEKAKAEFVSAGHRVSTIKSLQVYLKPEENGAYYVINQKFAGKVDLF